MSHRVVWEPEAEEDLRSLRSWQDAASVVRAVDRLAELGEGDLRKKREGSRARTLVLPGYRVDLNIDRDGTIYVWSVRRTPSAR